MVATFARLPTTPFVSPLVNPVVSSLGLPAKPPAPAPSIPVAIQPKKGALVNRYMPPRQPLSQRPGFAFRSAQSTAVKPQSASLHKWLWPNAGDGNSDAIRPAANTSTNNAGNSAVVPSGYSDLDAELPGGGWPLRQVTELLLPQSACGELRLLLPLLQRTSREGKTVALISPADCETNASTAAQHGALSTFSPSSSPSPSPFSAIASLLPSLNAEGLYIDHLMIMQPGAGKLASNAAGNGSNSCDALLTAAEQALHSAQFAVVVLWWPRPMKAEQTRRLHAAAAASRGAVFVCRPITAELETSPAALRLALCTVPEVCLQKQTMHVDSPLPNLPAQTKLKLVASGSSGGQNHVQHEQKPTAKLSVRLIKRRGAVSTCNLQLQVGKPSETLQSIKPIKPAFRHVKSDASYSGSTSSHGLSNDLNDDRSNSRNEANRGDGRQFMSGSFDDIIAALDRASQADQAHSQLNA